MKRQHGSIHTDKPVLILQPGGEGEQILLPSLGLSGQGGGGGGGGEGRSGGGLRSSYREEENCIIGAFNMRLKQAQLVRHEHAELMSLQARHHKDCSLPKHFKLAFAFPCCPPE